VQGLGGGDDWANAPVARKLAMRMQAACRELMELSGIERAMVLSERGAPCFRV